MSIKFDNYHGGYKVVSLAINENAKSELLKNDLEFIYFNNEKVVLYPNEQVLSNNISDINELKQYNNFDVLEIWENGVLYRVYNDKSDDNYFFITGKCNSNCIMCPSPDFSRKNAEEKNIYDLIELAKHIPKDAPHLTITGGEPFLIGEKIFPFFKYLKDNFTETQFLFLTNGRIFAIDKYFELFKNSIPYDSIVAIPIHGSCNEIHDYITRSKGSLRQTTAGIKKLLKNNIKVEIRLVVNKLNINDFEKIAEFIVKEFARIEYVSIIAMEITGNARLNKEQVWISYKESFKYIKSALNKLFSGGIDVKLYNFPLCTVDKEYWTLCEKSISDNKVRFGEECNTCKYKNSCSGVFSGTFQLEKDELKAIL